MKLKLGEDQLTYNIIERFVENNIEVVLSDKRRKKLKEVREYIQNHLDEEHTYYGINTGFGRLANVKVNIDQIEELQENLIRSHACGTGNNMDNNLVRVMMLLRAHVLAMGYSGASLEVADLLIQMINKRVSPQVPEQGSVGACGDLAPLAFIALAMIGEGEVDYKGKIYNAASGLKKAGLSPVKLKAKDGLSLINGTQAMSSHASLAVIRMRKLILLSDVSAALSVEGLRGSKSPFYHRIHEIRRQTGQERSAEMMRRLMEGSDIISSHTDCRRVQDPYSFRCVPQVHGAVRDSFRHVSVVIEKEINSCTDNPLVFREEDKIVSGGNFHGEPVAIAMDFLAIAASELGSIAERRIEQLTNPKSKDIPVVYLTRDAGLNSGYMVPHVVTSSLVSENKTLSHPASVDTIPTFAGQEDHVSMGMWAARKVHKILDNLEWIITIELASAAQAIDLHEEKRKPGKGTEIAYRFVRDHLKYLERDRFLMPELRRLYQSIKEDTLLKDISQAIGEWLI